jgi:hypothetical protein
MNLDRKKVSIILALSTFIILCIILLAILIPKRNISSRGSKSRDDGNNNNNRNDSKISETSEIPIVSEDHKKSNNLYTNNTSEIPGTANISKMSEIPKVFEEPKKFNNLLNGLSGDPATSNVSETSGISKVSEDPMKPVNLENTNNANGNNSGTSDPSTEPEIPRVFKVSDNFTLFPISPDEYQKSVQEKIQKVKAAPSSDKFTVLLNILESSYPFFPIALRVLLREMLFDELEAKPLFFQYRYLTLLYSNDLKMLLDLSKLSQSDLDGHPGGVLKIFDSFVRGVMDPEDSSKANPPYPNDLLIGDWTATNKALFEICQDFREGSVQVSCVIRDLQQLVLKGQREYVEYIQNPPPKKFYPTPQKMSNQLDKFKISSFDTIQFMDLLSSLPLEQLRPIFQTSGKYVVFYFLAESRLEPILNAPDDSFLLIKDLWEEIGIVLKNLFENEQVEDSGLTNKLILLNKKLKEVKNTCKDRHALEILKLFDGFFQPNFHFFSGIDTPAFRREVALRKAKLKFYPVMSQFNLIEDRDKRKLMNTNWRIS